MKRLLLIGLFLLSASTRVQGAFLNDGVTARTSALGGTAVAMTDDAAALFTNPAGLADARQRQIILDHNQMAVGMADGSDVARHFVGGAYPLGEQGTLGVGWTQLKVDSLYSEDVLALGYGRSWGPQIRWGAAIKRLHVAYRPSSIVVDDYGNVQPGTPDLFSRFGRERTAYSADIGLLLAWASGHVLGLTAHDVNEPNMALSSEDSDPLRRSFRAAYAWTRPSRWSLGLGVETREILVHQRDWIATGSAEKKWGEGPVEHVGLRGSVSMGSRQLRRVAVGASYGLTSLRFDYAFGMNLGAFSFADQVGDHRLTMAYFFGGPTKTGMSTAAIPQVPQVARIVPSQPEWADLVALLNVGN